MNFRIPAILTLLTVAFGCAKAPESAPKPMNANTAVPPKSYDAARDTITIAERPQSIKDQMAMRGEQDEALPKLTIVEPKEGLTVTSSTVKVKLIIAGDLKGYMPHMDPETKTGNHIHVILDNQPYEAYYNLDNEFELRNVVDGEHTVRIFASRPWHESYKNEGSFQMVRFIVKNGGGDATKPTTTGSGDTMASPTPEGKDMKESTAGAVDPQKPLLTYSRPKGEYKDANADAIMIDFWLSNAELGDGKPYMPGNDIDINRQKSSRYRVRYSINDGAAMYIDKWEPIWLSGWSAGTHTVKLELVDGNGNVVDNGGYNSTTREITVVK